MKRRMRAALLLAAILSAPGGAENRTSGAAGRAAIAFCSSRDGNWEIYVMNADGSDQTRLTENPGHDWEPAWSPDGTRIAFHSQRPPGKRGGSIYVMDSDGSHQTRLTHDPALDSTPTWSPEGTRIAFSRDSCWQVSLEKCPGKSEITLMSDRGGDVVRLTKNRFEDDMPDWLVVPE